MKDRGGSTEEPGSEHARVDMSLKLLSAIVEQSTEGIAVASLDGNILFANKAWAELHGYESGGELVDLHLSVFHTREQLTQEVMPFNAKAMKEGHHKGEVGHARRDGTPFPTLMTTTIIRNEAGKPIAMAGFAKDITESKKAEVALRRSEERFRMAARVSSDLIYEWHVADDSLDWFGEFEEVLGYEPGEIPGNIASWVDLIHPEDRALLSDAVEHHRTSTEQIRYAYRVKAKDGTWRHWLDRGLPVLDDQRRPTHWIGACVDVTERKMREERVRHLNRVLRAIRNVNQLIIRETERGPLIQGICDSLVETRGYFSAWIALLEESGTISMTAEAGLGETFVPLAEMLERGEMTRCGREALARPGAFPIEDPTVSCSDCPLSGRYIDRAGISIRIEHAGKVYGLLTCSTHRQYATDDEEMDLLAEVAGDIAFSLHGMELEEDRMRGQEALRERDMRYRALFDNSLQLLYVHDFQGRFLDANKQTLSLFGYRSDEILELGFSDLLDAEDLPRALASASHIFEHGTDEETHEYRLKTKDGDHVWVELTGVRLDTAGQPQAILGIGRDITGRKQAQEKRRSLEAQLRQSQKMEAIGSLAAGIAHDFNNLLGVIIGYSGLSLEELSEVDPVRSSVMEIDFAANRAAELTKQLLAFSRKQVLLPRMLDLNDLISDMETMIPRLLGEDIDIRIVAEPDRCRFEADPGQIEQVIMNLLINARDAMPTRGSLTIKTANVELDEAQSMSMPDLGPGSYVMLVVSDTGHGMDEGTTARVFEPFFSTKGEKGTGMGLSIAYGIVKQSGGHIVVNSEVGQGTTFRIYLPRVTSGGVNEARPRVAAGPSHGTETILVVEDEVALLNLVTRILEHRGYTVLPAPNAGEAMLVCKSHKGPIHLMITDVVMPRMSGPELVGWVGSRLEDMRVLYMSGYMDNTVAQHIIVDDGVNLITKPFRPEALLAKVREILDT